MKWIIKILLISFLSADLYSNEVLNNRGGDDAGNGGFAYKQSIKILKLAAEDLETKINNVTIKEFEDHPEWRTLLSNVLKYDNLEKSWWRTRSRNGQPLSMDYNLVKPKVIVLKYYYQSFMGKTDNEIDESVKETQKRLIHEASHIWGFKENESEEFAERFLMFANLEDVRISRDITINQNFCSCKNGESDIINDCDEFCADQKVSLTPMLYLDVVLGIETLKNPKIKNLYDWCNKQLVGDSTAPQCTLTAWDGTNTIDNIPLINKKNSNSITADISSLAYNRTYIVKIVESKTGANAETQEFQIRRIKRNQEEDTLNMVEIVPISQYSCLKYSGVVNPDGTMTRTNYLRDYYYFLQNFPPAPIPHSGGIQTLVCHDEILYGKEDSSMYPRLELQENKISIFRSGDPAFSVNNGKLRINSLIEKRLKEEFAINATIDLVTPLRLIDPRINQAHLGGMMMVPFSRTQSGLSFCPTIQEYYGNEPLFNIMKDYFSETEGLYVGEGDPEKINVNGSYQTYYANQFLKESDLLKYGFTYVNGVKVKITSTLMHRGVVYFYYPFSDSKDSLEQGGRKIFTVRYLDELNGKNSNQSNQYRTTDKRIGCIPKN